MDKEIIIKNRKTSNMYKYVYSALVIILLIGGVSYAFFDYYKESVDNHQLVTGDIYLNYENETGILKLNNIFPETVSKARSRNDNQITFTIEGRNTSKNKDVYYEIMLSEGADILGKNRFNPEDMRFDLIEVIDEQDVYLISAGTLENLNRARLWVDTVNRNTSEAANLRRTYKLRMWLSEDVLISDTNPNANYTSEEFKNSYANVKISVYGDFVHKEIDDDIMVSSSLSSVGRSMLRGVATTNNTYDVKKDYDSLEYTSYNVVVDLTSAKNLSKIVITNIDTNVVTEYEPTFNNGLYNVTVQYSSSGRYNYYGIMEDGTYTSIGYFNIKIDRYAPMFTIQDGVSVVLENSNARYRIENTVSNIDEDNGYVIEYAVVKSGLTPNRYTNTNNVIETQVESGLWDLVVKVTDFSGKESIERTTYTVGYSVVIIANNNNGYTIPKSSIQLVKGQRYGYLENLPAVSNINFLGYSTDQIGNNVVTNDIIVRDGVSALYAVWADANREVIIPTANEYCSNPIYNGEKQSLVSKTNKGIILSNYLQKNAGTYTITATLKPGFVWDDQTKDPITFQCNISKNAITYQAESISKEYDGEALTSNNAVLVSGNLGISDVASFVLSGSQTEVGSSTNTLSTVTITNANGSNVTSNYEITKLNGTLTVTNNTNISCVFSGPSNSLIGVNETTIYTLSCTSNSEFNDSTIVSSNIVFDNPGIISIGTPVKEIIPNGFRYTITALGLIEGSSSLTLNEGSVSVVSGKVNSEVTSSSVTVSNDNSNGQ